MDFRDEFPRYCNICTSHTTADLQDDVDKWCVIALAVTIGTHLGMNDRATVEHHLLKMKQAGFDFQVLANFTDEQIMSEDLDQLRPGLPGHFRTQTILAQDPSKTGPFGNPSYIRFVFFFE